MSKLKRVSGTRHLAVPSNNNAFPINVILNGNNGNNANMAVAATPTSLAPSPILTPTRAQAVHSKVNQMHMPTPMKRTFNVRNTEQPHHAYASAFGKQALQPLKVSRRNRHRKNRTRRTRRRG